MKVNLSKKEKTWFVIIGISILGLTIVFSQFSWLFSFEDTGEIGDTIGGITAPFLSFFGAILVYMAFKAQIDANDEIKRQFEEREIQESNDFIFSNYKERIELIISEINSFNISFHDNTLIKSINVTKINSGKKYNFIGIQAINLYLIEYFRLKEEHELRATRKFELDHSFQAIFLNINNLIGLFYRTHIEIVGSSLDDSYKSKLEELLKYTYFSKLNYFLGLYKHHDPDDKLNLNVDLLYNYYKL